MPQGGYTGKYLDVDLTSGSFQPVTLPEETLATWVGCTGLGLHLLAQEITSDMKPTDPEAPIFILTGPLTGTTAPSSSIATSFAIPPSGMRACWTTDRCAMVGWRQGRAPVGAYVSTAGPCHELPIIAAYGWL